MNGLMPQINKMMPGAMPPFQLPGFGQGQPEIPQMLPPDVPPQMPFELGGFGEGQPSIPQNQNLMTASPEIAPLLPPDVSDPQLDEYTGKPFTIYGGKKAKGYKEAENKFASLWDKKERFEIDDSKARLIKKDLNWNKLYKLSEILRHPELYKNYPELEDTRVIVKPGIGEKGAEFDRNKKIIYIDPSNKSTYEKMVKIFHEVQHQIQYKEGFARGGSVKEFVDPVDTLFSTKEERRENHMKAMRKYWHLAGEIESRDTSDRMPLPMGLRRDVPPYTGQKLDRMITKFRHTQRK